MRSNTFNKEFERLKQITNAALKDKIILTPGMYHYWDLNFGKRPAEELYNIARDSDYLHNLADDPAYADLKENLKTELYQKLKQQEIRGCLVGDISLTPTGMLTSKLGGSTSDT